MIEIFKRLNFISPPIMNELFRLRNIPYTTRNLRDLDSRLPKTLNAHVKFAKHILEDWDSLNQTRRANFKLVIVNIVFSMLNKVNE